MRRDKAKNRMGLLVFVGIAAIILYHFLSGDRWLFLSPPPLHYLSVNFTYWLVAGSGLLSVLSSSAFYYIFLGLVPAMIVLHRYAPVAWLFSALLAAYMITFNALAGHHYHSMVAAFAVTVPFWFRDEKAFWIVFSGVRFYACFFFASAALWKIWRGSVFDHGHVANLIQLEYANLLTAHPDGFAARVLLLIIDNPWIGDVLFGMVVLIQLAFAVGFFTGRFDTLLLLLIVVFIAGNYIFFHVASWEVLIFALCFVRPRWLQASGRGGSKTTDVAGGP